MEVFGWTLAVVLAPLLVYLGVRIAQQHDHGVVFRFGKFFGVRDPGFNLIVPIADRMASVDMRVVTMAAEPQEVITKNNVTITGLAAASTGLGTFQVRQAAARNN